MKGYIALSSSEWCQNIEHSNIHEAIFWRKKQCFKALLEGDPFYFLSRSSTIAPNNRMIVGKAYFKDFCVKTAKTAWLEFGTKLGFESQKEFFDNVNAIYKASDVSLGCIVLNRLCFLNEPISLQKVGIDFSPYIVSGKTINEDECQWLDKFFNEEKNT